MANKTNIRKKVKARIDQIKKDQSGMTDEDREIMKDKAAKMLQDLYEKETN